VKHSAGALVNAVHHWESDGDDSLDFPQPDNSSEMECSSSTSSSDGPGDTFELECFPSTDKSPTFSFAKFGTAQFAEWVIAGDVITATHCLVQQSLMQAPVSLYLEISAKLAPHAIKLFLNIAKSLMTTGQAHHDVLSTILELLLDMIPPDCLEWPTMPSTISGFQSHVLNPTNKHSLVSILPVPATYMLPDRCHAYCCLQEIAAFVLLLPRTAGVAPVPLRLVQLCQSKTMKDFLGSSPPIRRTQCLVSLGVIFWLDGWDPSASSKNNRSPVHTSTVTLLCIDNTTGLPFNARTFPIACGPGKANHDAVFTALRSSLDALTASTNIVWSHHHGRWTTLRACLLAFLMDQPERRGSNCLLGGNSRYHGIFGVSCNFKHLERPFPACPKCLRVATRYLEAKNFKDPMEFACRLCYGFSLSRLVTHGRYITSCHPKLSVATPGSTLTDKPGPISFELLIDAWHFAVQRFVCKKDWSKDQVQAYLSMLCINKATIADFTLRCGNYLLVQNLDARPEEYHVTMLAYVNNDRACHPHLYSLPAPPSAWNIGTLGQRVETIMHLAMNTQKAVFKLVLHWASSLDQGPTLKRKLQPLLESVKVLRLPYIPCRKFKNEKFGGWVAENYRALNMLSPWLFRFLSDDEFAPAVVVLAPEGKPRSKWTIKENTAWLKVRGKKVPANTVAAELTSIVQNYHDDPAGLPELVPDVTPSAKEVRYLLLLLFRVFATLFSRDLKGAEAGNRFDALVVQFLVCVQKLGHACHPNKKQPIWLSKYGMLGLLRCHQHFLDYSYPHSLYEGGIEGEGMVKELRPLCPNAVRAGWPLNLMNAYNRQNILGSLNSGFESQSSLATPTAAQHDANGRLYSSWADVEHALENTSPMSIVVLGTELSWKCHVLVHMFRVTYTREILIGDSSSPTIDEYGFVYHAISLAEHKSEYDRAKPVLSFALMLPIKRQDGLIQFCLLDKDWRFVGTEKTWTILD
jgi:hypothetical protein